MYKRKAEIMAMIASDTKQGSMRPLNAKHITLNNIPMWVVIYDNGYRYYLWLIIEFLKGHYDTGN